MIRPRALALFFVALGGLTLIGCGSSDDGSGTGADDASGSASSAVESTTTTAAATTIAPTESSSPDGDNAGLAQWSGRYLWDEFVDGDPGSDQTMVHELVIVDAIAIEDMATDAGATDAGATDAGATDDRGLGMPGRLTQNGFQTATEFTVAADPIEAGIAIEIVSVDAGLTSLRPGDIAFTLTGDPAKPLTTLVALVPLVADRAITGSYFVREGDSDQALGRIDGVPATFWAIEAVTYDLIEIDVVTGLEVRRVAGWGAEAAASTIAGGQALTSVDVSADGMIWADDCCEPAAGSVFGLDPDSTSAILDDATVDNDGVVQMIGLNPVASPDGSLIATGSGIFDAAVIDPAGNVVGSIGPVGSDGGADDGTDAGAVVWSPIPVAWIDAGTLVTATPGDDGLTIEAWDLGDPTNPTPIGQPSTVPGHLIDGVRWDGGSVLVVTGFGDGSDRSGFVVETDGSEPELIDIPDGLETIDVDPSGRFFLHVGPDGLARFGPIDGQTVLSETGVQSATGVLSEIEVVAASW